jgi:prolyl-tRNA editing enzyme YbaK/EbsC (Cys-tRNA(Pro) deacylase)
MTPLSPDASAPTVTDRIVALLNAAGVAYTRLEHPVVKTSEEAARTRGTPLEIGGKSLLFKIGKTSDFRLFVVSAARRTDNRPMRRFFGVQKLRFARREELMVHTGLEPGCVPPFGPPVFDVPLYVDTHLAGLEEIAFTAANHRLSIRMKMADYLAVAKPAAVFSFSRP